jgi:hypothetical protein
MLIGLLSTPLTSKITAMGTIMHMDPFTHDAYKEACIEDEEFKEVHVEQGDSKVDYHLQNGLLYKLEKPYVPKGERLHIIREAHTSKVVGNFGVEKTFSNLQRYVY